MDILSGILAIVLLYIVLKLLKVSIPLLSKLVINGVIGLITLVIFNVIGGLIGLSIEITVVNAIIAGIFGIPGIIVILILNA